MALGQVNTDSAARPRDPDKCGCRDQFPHVAGEVPTCVYAPMLDAMRRSESGDGWCREHDEREPCQVCGVRRAVDSARPQPLVSEGHSQGSTGTQFRQDLTEPPGMV